MNGKHSLPIRIVDRFYVKDAGGEHLGTIAHPDFGETVVRAVNNEQRYRTALEAICELIKEGGFGWRQSALVIAASALSTEGGE